MQAGPAGRAKVVVDGRTDERVWERDQPLNGSGMIAEQMPDLPRKTARKQAMASLATMMGTLVLARVAGSGEFSEDILGAGREAVLDRMAAAKAGGRKSAPRKAAAPARH